MARQASELSLPLIFSRHLLRCGLFTMAVVLAAASGQAMVQETEPPSTEDVLKDSGYAVDDRDSNPAPSEPAHTGLTQDQLLMGSGYELVPAEGPTREEVLARSGVEHVPSQVLTQDVVLAESGYEQTSAQVLDTEGERPASTDASALGPEHIDEATVIQVQHSQSGDGPCGFSIQRDLEGTVRVTPSLDDQGNLVLMIDDVQLSGTLTNLENNQVVEIRWVRQDGSVGSEFNGSATTIMLQLVGSVNRGYDSADSTITMDLPLDGAETISFVTDGQNAKAWAHVCALLD